MQSKKRVVLFAVAFLGWFSSATMAQPDFPHNSVVKRRPPAGPLARQAGSAIDWRPDFDTAWKESQKTGKPIFWYVPTLRGSFMDRTTSIDRYMMAGPFSWPDIIATINQQTIPVKAKPNHRLRKQYRIVPYVFIEPGFLILKSDGSVKLKVDRMTTLSPEWFRHLLRQGLEQPIERPVRSKRLEMLWSRFESGDYTFEARPADPSSLPPSMEELLLQGMFEFRRGEHDRARQTWAEASRLHPNDPLAWKAAAEAEGFGPFVRGFEVHRKIPDAALKAGIDSAGSTAPKGVYSEDQIWERGIDFLLGMQNQDGGFTDSNYDFGGTDSLPNVYTAVTSLAGMALLKASSRTKDASRKKRIDTAIARAARYVLDEKHLNRSDADELVWALAYRLRFIARLNAGAPECGAKLQPLVDDLEAIQSRSGGFFHEYPNAFVTATALIALREAADAGASVSRETIKRAVASLGHDRMKNGAYPYESRSGQGKPVAGTDYEIAASAGRMPICELGLWVWDASTDGLLERAIERSFALNENLMVALKYDDHTSRMAYGGFFFWYDLRGRSEAIERLPEGASKLRFQNLQRQLIRSLPELDGCFVDSHELGRVYGTAMALLSW